MSSGQELSLEDVGRARLGAPRPLPTLLISRDPAAVPAGDNTAVLQTTQDGAWRTGWFERGRLHDERSFPTEDEACRDFLALLGLAVPD